MYASHQLAARKAVERVFGVLFSRFHILCRPARLWDKRDLNKVVKACAIIHNMVVEHRKDTYSGTTNIRGYEEEIEQNLPIKLEDVLRPESTYEQALFWREALDPTEDAVQHSLLQNALADHIWNMKGDVDMSVMDPTCE